MGIQSLDPEVLKSENRVYQKLEKIKEIAKECLSDNFIFNVDLIMGLEKDTPEKFIDTFTSVLDLKPTTITIYKLRPTEKYTLKDKSANFLSEHYHLMLDSTHNKLENLATKRGYKQFGSLNSMDAFFYVHETQYKNIGKINP